MARSKLKRLFYMLAFVLLIVIYGNLNSYFEIKNKVSTIDHPQQQQQQHLFDINQHVLVFVHVQKTGGSDLDRKIVRHLLVSSSSSSSSSSVVWRQACEFVPNNTLSAALDSDSPSSDQAPKGKKGIKFKKFACKREHPIAAHDSNWYFSRQTFGWICGLHPYHAELSSCVRKFYPTFPPERFKYFTILRSKQILTFSTPFIEQQL